MADGFDARAATASGDAFLGVRRSLMNRPWRLREAEARLVRDLQQRHALPEPLARTLAARGVGLEDAEHHLRPTLRALFPDPASFKDMELAATILVEGAAARRRIVVFADYDVDGAASAALLVRWFRSVGTEIGIYVPDRINEGYGPSPAAFERLKAQGADMVVTVDCGAAAHDALIRAAELELPVVVIDHHLMRQGCAPPCAALVNPNQPGCASGQGALPAAGVTFVLLAACNRVARRSGLFNGRPQPDLRLWLDLAALGSICDVTELTGFNRALAVQGLKVMSGWSNPGLRSLLAAASASGPATRFHAGYVLGPRINAGGRIGRSDLGARLLATDDAVEAEALAAELDRLNACRKDIERQALDEARRLAERALEQRPDRRLILVSAEAWHPGVVGIVAGRLREQFRRPVIVIALDPASGIGKGSGRSQPGINLGRAVHAAFEEGLLLAGGGHAMAAGLTVRSADLERLGERLEILLAETSGSNVDEDVLEIDALGAPGPALRSLYDAYQALEPFGAGAPEPVIGLAGVRVDGVRVMRGGHVRCMLAAEDGSRIRAVAWRAEETRLGRRLLQGGGALHVAGRLKADDWSGPGRVEMEIEDAADPRRSDNL